MVEDPPGLADGPERVAQLDPKIDRLGEPSTRSVARMTSYVDRFAPEPLECLSHVSIHRFQHSLSSRRVLPRRSPNKRMQPTTRKARRG